MKYQFIHKKQKSNTVAYVITKEQKIVWANNGLEVFVGKSITELLSWVERRDLYSWRVVGSQCTAPRYVVTRSVQQEAA